MSSITPDPAASGTTLERRGIPLGDLLFRGIAGAASLGAVLLLGWIAWKVFDLALPAIETFGLEFIWTEVWDPVADNYGALTFIYGTTVTSFIALLIATPLSIAIALFLTEIAPRRLAAPIATMVELLAAIPSVVLGLWGILVFGPWVARNLEPWLESWLGWLPIFSGEASPAGILPAALVLTIMIVPITSAICRELFARTPRELTDGAMALGSTRWEAIRGVMFAYAAPGIAAAVLLGLGRAFGEAIAVTQVIGGADFISRSLYAPGDTLGSRIASQYQGATTPLQQGSLLYLAAILMVISLVTNVLAQLIVRRFEAAESRMSTLDARDRHDVTAGSNNLRRRRRVEKAFAGVGIFSAFVAVGVLALVLGSVVYNGLSELELDFFTKPRPLFGEEGGIADALVGSALIVGMCIVVAVPLAVLIAIYMSEYAGPRTSTFLRIVLDVLNGVPAIVVGIFIFGILVVGRGQSAIFGALALAILMLPMVARATQEVLEIVPRSQREASLALGVSKWRTTWSIILPSAIGGILTGVVIAVARVAGETAPLLFTSSIAANAISTDVTNALPTLPVAIFVFADSPDPGEQAAGWAAALVLIAFVLVLNIVAKLIAGRQRRKLEGT